MKFSPIKPILCGLLLAALLIACRREPLPVDDGSIDQETELSDEEILALAEHFTPTRVSEEEFLQTAEDALTLLDESFAQTKSGQKRHIGDISAIKGKLINATNTKSTLPEDDTLAYVVSFGDDLGYAVLSADHRTDAILALCPEGNFSNYDSNDTVTGASIFYEKLADYFAEEIAAAEKRQEEYFESAWEKYLQSQEDLLDEDSTRVCVGENYKESIAEDTPSPWSLVLSSSSGPMLKVQWHQDYPCNAECPIDPKSGQHCAVGCVATAAAQLMSYWEYPTTWNWPAMKLFADPARISATAQQELARLMYEIGKGINMDYGYPESSASTSNLGNYFKRIGYGNSGEYKKYNDNKVRQSLLSNIPIIIRGTNSKSGGGHAWVLDGYRTWERTVRVTVRRYGIVALKSGTIRANPNKNHQWVESTYTRIERLQMVNCNFGWRSTIYNGYYNSQVFNTGAKPAAPGQNAHNSNGANYNSDLYCLYNIKP